MLDQITNDTTLYGLLRNCCEENGISVTFCDALKINDEINDDLLKILKVDEYFSTKNFAMPPKSIDYLVVVDEGGHQYSLYLLEFRNVSHPTGARPDSIYEKFANTVSKFLHGDFSVIFTSEKFEVIKMKTWLVIDCFGIPGLDEDTFRKKVRASCLERLTLMPILKFRGLVSAIEAKQPKTTIC